MGLIKIKQKKCPKSNKKDKDDEKEKKCSGGFVYIIRILALAWLISLGLLIAYALALLFYYLLKSSYDEEDKSGIDEHVLRSLEALINFLNFVSYPCLCIFTILSCLFLILYIICEYIIPIFLMPWIWVIPIAIIIAIFNPICCALWETGVFVIIKALFEAITGGGNVDIGSIFSFENLRNMANSETNDESLKKILTTVPDPPIEFNYNDGDASTSNTINTSNSNEAMFPNDDKIKQIEYQNCLAKYKEDSSVDTSTAFVLNSLHELKCYQKAISVGINSYNDGTCVKDKKSYLSKGIESIGPAKQSLSRQFKELEEESTCSSTTSCTSNYASDMTFCSNLMICHNGNHTYCSNRRCDDIESSDCTDVYSFSDHIDDDSCSNYLIYFKEIPKETENKEKNNEDDDTEKPIKNLVTSVKCNFKKL